MPNPFYRPPQTLAQLIEDMKANKKYDDPNEKDQQAEHHDNDQKLYQHFQTK